MELFAPDNLPGVGMGDLDSVVATCGLLGLAVTSGMLLAQGMLGTIVFVLGALLVLSEKPDWGGSTAGVLVVVGVLLAAAAARIALERGARGALAGLAGAAADAPETKATRRAATQRRARATGLGLLAVAIGGGAAGFSWAEWNEVPFHLGDTESWIGLVLGVAAGVIGGGFVVRFLEGSVRAGGNPVVVGFATCLVALLLNSASVYVPFAGIVVLVLVGVLALRLRRRAGEKYAGLRILS